MNIVQVAQVAALSQMAKRLALALVVGSPGGGLTRWWYGIIDSWFGITITIGIIAMVIGAIASIIKTVGKGTSND